MTKQVILAASLLPLLACESKAVGAGSSAHPGGPDASGSSASDGPRSAALDGKDIAALKPGAPYALKEVELAGSEAPLLKEGEGAFTFWAGQTEGGTRVLAYVAPVEQPEQVSMTLLDDKGRRLAQVEDVYDDSHGFDGRPSRTSSVLVTDVEDNAAVLDLVTGAVVTPKPVLPRGETAEATYLLRAENSDLVWVLTRTESKRVFAGPWTSTEDTKVAVTTELPFLPGCDPIGSTNAVEFEREKESFPDRQVQRRFGRAPVDSQCRGEGLRPVSIETPLSESCERVRLGADGRATCRAEVADEDGKRVEFHGDWAVSGSTLFGPDGESHDAPSAALLRAYDPAPHMLFIVGDDLVLWTPKTERRFRGASMLVNGHQRHWAAASPVASTVPVNELATTWVNFEAQSIHHGETGWRQADPYSAQSRFYATRSEGEDVVVAEIDLSDSSVREVARYDNCSESQLSVRKQPGHVLAVMCASFRADRTRAWVWSEVLDLDAGFRAPVDGWIEDTQLDDGRILVSNDEKSHSLLAKNLRFIELRPSFGE